MAITVERPDGTELVLSPDQEDALVIALCEIGADHESMLAGAAGTGKTTVLLAVIALWEGKIACAELDPVAARLNMSLPEWVGQRRGRVILLAPTGVAARRAASQTGHSGTTIHSALFAMVEEGKSNGRREKLNFSEARPPQECGPRDLVVIDEGSMPGKALAAQVREQVLQRAHSNLLVVGDHEQLGPVDPDGDGEWGFKLYNARARLEQVHRQAEGSATLDFGTCIRQRTMSQFNRWSDDTNVGVWLRRGATIEQAVAWAEAKPGQRVLITFTNKIRAAANRLTRESRGYPKKEVVVGETLMNLFNNHELGIMNGETFVVSEVEPCEPLSKAIGKTVVWVTEAVEEGKARRFLVMPELFDTFHPHQSDRKVYRGAWKPLWARRVMPEGEENDSQLCDRMDWSWEDLHRWRDTSRKFGLQATYAYCLTAHKSQGQQYPEVAFISCPTYRSLEDEDFRRRIAYVSATRAESVFGSFLLSVNPDFRKKNPYEAGASK